MTSCTQRSSREIWQSKGVILIAVAAGSVGGLVGVCCHEAWRSFSTPQSAMGEAVKEKADVRIEFDDQTQTIDRDEFGRQVAVSVLITHPHDITADQIVIYRDKTRSGNALQQFADLMGGAITGKSRPGLVSDGDRP